jgi:hypothetical protein
VTSAQRGLADRLRAEGRPHPDVAAAVLVARGRRILDQAGLAELAGVGIELVRSLETGHRPAAHVPRRLSELAADVDWAGAGVRGRRDLADIAARHPAAWPGAPTGRGDRMPPWRSCASSTG